MRPQVALPSTAQVMLRCPECHSKLTEAGRELTCANPECRTHYPIVDGIPVLINERSSAFSISDFVSRRETYFGGPGNRGLVSATQRLMPGISKNIKGKANYARMRDALLGRSASPLVLVIGGSSLGEGMEPLLTNAGIALVETDVSFGQRTMLICDAHDIPFEDGSFDGVVVQAVLEHVVDPNRCCNEIHRVLKTQGVVYAETAFMQQVHGGRYDFTRFTHLGHRRLFRKFDEVDSGIVCGPGMALAWSCQYFLLSFTSSRALRALSRILAGVMCFHLKYLDHYLVGKRNSLDAASAYYFLGKKSEQALTDRHLVELYKQANSSR